MDYEADEADDPESEDPEGANELLGEYRERAPQQANRYSETDSREKAAGAPWFGEMRKSGEVKLNRLSSISGGGGSKSRRAVPKGA